MLQFDTALCAWFGVGAGTPGGVGEAVVVIWLVELRVAVLSAVSTQYAYPVRNETCVSPGTLPKQDQEGLKFQHKGSSPAQNPVEQSLDTAGFHKKNCVSVMKYLFSIVIHESPAVMILAKIASFAEDIGGLGLKLTLRCVPLDAVFRLTRLDGTCRCWRDDRCGDGHSSRVRGDISGATTVCIDCKVSL